jgi:hypothetical protein
MSYDSHAKIFKIGRNYSEFGDEEALEVYKIGMTFSPAQPPFFG